MDPESYVHADAGEVVSLYYPSSGQDFIEIQCQQILEFLVLLSSVLQPLAIDLWLASRKRWDAIIDFDMVPEIVNWHIQDTNVPEYVKIQSNSGENPKKTFISRLEPGIISQWLNDIQAYKAPDPEHVNILYALRITHTRVRLYGNSWYYTNTFPLRKGSNLIEFPIEKYDNEPWVLGPVSTFAVSAPIVIEFLNHDGVLEATISVAWSLWSTEGTPEHTHLQNVIKNILLRGWKPQLIPKTFDLQV